MGPGEEEETAEPARRLVRERRERQERLEAAERAALPPPNLFSGRPPVLNGDLENGSSDSSASGGRVANSADNNGDRDDGGEDPSRR